MNAIELIVWIIGIFLAEGFWSTLLAIFFPIWGLVVIIKCILDK